MKAQQRKSETTRDQILRATIRSLIEAGFSEQERLALEYAERFAEDPHGFAEDEGFWQCMHAAFGDDGIVDLTLSIAAWVAMGHVTHVLELDTVCMDEMLAA